MSYPALLNGSIGTSLSASLVSCMRRTSGCARSSHQATFSSRALSELTFHVAMRTRDSGHQAQHARWRAQDQGIRVALDRRGRFGELHELGVEGRAGAEGAGAGERTHGQTVAIQRI